MRVWIFGSDKEEHWKQDRSFKWIRTLTFFFLGQ